MKPIGEMSQIELAAYITSAHALLQSWQKCYNRSMKKQKSQYEEVAETAYDIAKKQLPLYRHKNSHIVLLGHNFTAAINMFRKTWI